MRPRLRTALVRLWRDHDTLQLGADPARAVLVAGLDPPTARLLDRVDGTRTPEDLYAAGDHFGVPHGRTRRLLDLLAEARLLEDADEAAAHLPAGTDRAAPDRLAPDRAAAGLLRRGLDGGAGAIA
ncbi:ThiF family adenylyltransferase, partial [Yinghuangia seranimata]|nr:ThiF family adenylyltransferase [Yinghuangia seranimata]